MSTILKAEWVNKSFPTRSGELVVLRDVSFSLSGAESIVIMGPSGSGKSTLLNILGTLDPPTSGRITLNGVDPYGLPERELASFRNRHIGFVFQDHHLLGQCSALENVLLPALAGGGGNGKRQRARVLLDRVGLADRMDHRPAELSGGERQRVAIARSLINAPTVLLADEPTGNLDRHTAGSVAALLFELQRDEGATLVTVTHNPELAAKFDRRFDLVDAALKACKGT